jgi:hypothetical protein
LAKKDEQLATIHRRLVAEFGEAGVLNKPMEWATFTDGGRVLKTGDYVFFFHPDEVDVLCCHVAEGDDAEEYRVQCGGLVKVGPAPFAEPSMN